MGVLDKIKNALFEVEYVEVVMKKLDDAEIVGLGCCVGIIIIPIIFLLLFLFLKENLGVPL